VALDDVSLETGPGVVVALLGENGAGKSTALKILMGLVDADAGDASVYGLDSRTQGEEIRRRVGYVPEQITLYD
jgi:ABC-2 type transport system ATP-binding protein